MSGRWKIELPGRRELAAAWWSASLRPRLPAGAGLIGRWSPPPIIWASAVGMAAGPGLGGCAGLLEQDGQPSSTEIAQQLQRDQGWTTGEPATLYFQNVQQTDVAGGPDWRATMSTLPLRLAPAEARWQPFYDPTLFQALSAPRNADLRMIMQPVFSPEMARASRRGEALLSLFAEEGCRNDVAVVIDIPGPEAVALAAALAPCFDPVFAFDNWPHPRGVVPSHLTLGTALYYLPWFERERPRRSPDAAPMFVFDRQRLVPYVDDSKWFDNRYFAGLPPFEALQAAGIRHILYVAPDADVATEADDLNEDFVELDRAGIDFRLLALSDFSETPLPGWLDDDDTAPPPDPAPPSPPQISLQVQLYFGGSPRTHACFWDWYGWRGRPVAGRLAPSLPTPLRPRATFHPIGRPTFGSGSGWHGTPTGAGSGWRGTPGGAGSGWHGTPAGRSGSLGRASFGGFSGG